MTIYEHVESLAGKPVVDWDPAEGIKDPESTIYCVSLDNDDAQKGVHWTDRFAQMLDDPASARLTGLVVGPWGFEFESGSAPVVAELVAACDRLPNLTVLFVGDIISEESEISWIEQSDVTPLLEAYPALVSPRLVKVATLAPRPRCGGVTQPNGRRPRRLLTRSTPPSPCGTTRDIERRGTDNHRSLARAPRRVRQAGGGPAGSGSPARASLTPRRLISV